MIVNTGTFVGHFASIYTPYIQGRSQTCILTRQSIMIQWCRFVHKLHFNFLADSGRLRPRKTEITIMSDHSDHLNFQQVYHEDESENCLDIYYLFDWLIIIFIQQFQIHTKLFDNWFWKKKWYRSINVKKKKKKRVKT